MSMNDILLVGEVIDVVGISTKVKVYKEKNTSRLVYNGKLVKNIAVGNYVKILKGFSEIIAVVEGEYIKESKTVDPYCKHSDTYSRVLDVKILGHISNHKFIKGVFETPMISNYVYVLEEEEVQKIFCFTKDDEPVISIGNITGYDGYSLKLSIQKLFASHIGIFGNTGSGKSNTLAKVFTELFDSGINYKRSKFIIIDFNNEYITKEVLTDDKKIYKLNTSHNQGDKYYLSTKVIEDSTFWSIILDATEKTQKPFLERVIKSYRYYRSNYICFENLIAPIFENPHKLNKVKTELTQLLQLMYGGEAYNYEVLYQSLEYNATNFYLYDSSRKIFIDKEQDLEDYFIARNSEIDNFDVFRNIDGKSCDSLALFNIVLKEKHIFEVLKGYSIDEHISPLIKRSTKRINEIGRVFEFAEEISGDKSVEVISLSNCNVQMKKIIPLLICKEVYDIQKIGSRGDSSLHIIVDEAHNILSENSNRESASWKDYRLEVFEEIIKEGRKFGCFLTISSQRPSDISATLISQLHNYFIHRLVNDEDLFTIRKSVAFLDRSKQEMISILSQGQCICSGLALDFPVNVQVDELSDRLKPDSKDIDLIELWS